MNQEEIDTRRLLKIQLDGVWSHCEERDYWQAISRVTRQVLPLMLKLYESTRGDVSSAL